MRRTAVSMILGVVLMTATPSTAEPDPLLVQVLTDLSTETHLELTRLDGARIAGTYAGLSDSLLTFLPVMDDAPAISPITIPLEQIVLVRRPGSGAAAGFEDGVKLGAVIGGLLGFGVFAGLSAMFDNDTDFDVAVAGGGLGAITFGLIGGGIGAAAGSGHTTWSTIYSAPGFGPPSAAPEPVPPPPAAATGPSHLWAHVTGGLSLGDYDEASENRTGWFGQLALMNRRSRRFEIGPTLGVYTLRSAWPGTDPGNPSYELSHAVWSFELSATRHFGNRGLHPYLTVGSGLYIAEDPYLGVSFGGGLIYQRPDAADFKFEVRDHLNLSKGVPLTPDYFLTAGLGFSFGL